MTTYKWAICIYIKVFDRQYKGRVQSLAVCAGTENFQRVGWGGVSKCIILLCLLWRREGFEAIFGNYTM